MHLLHSQPLSAVRGPREAVQLGEKSLANTALHREVIPKQECTSAVQCIGRYVGGTRHNDLDDSRRRPAFSRTSHSCVRKSPEQKPLKLGIDRLLRWRSG